MNLITNSSTEIENLSEEKIAELRCAFQLFDKDSDGKITTVELGDILRKLGYTPTDEDLMPMIQQVDTNGNGDVDFKEFLECIYLGVSA